MGGRRDQLKGGPLRLPTLLCLALVACERGEPTRTAPATSATVAPREPAAYDFSPQVALSKFSALGPFEVTESNGPCQAYVARDLALRICSSADGRVTSLLATSRRAAGAARLEQAVRAIASAVAPGSEVTDLRRISREAVEAKPRGGTTLCPTTRCFKLEFQAVGWALSASASS